MKNIRKRCIIFLHRRHTQNMIIVKKVGEVLGKKIEQIDNTVGEQHQIILSNERFKAELDLRSGADRKRQ